MTINALVYGLRDTLIIAALVCISTVVLIKSCSSDTEKTEVIRAEDFIEQCRHYHYSDDKVRVCMDKFLIKGK